MYIATGSYQNVLRHPRWQNVQFKSDEISRFYCSILHSPARSMVSTLKSGGSGSGSCPCWLLLTSAAVADWSVARHSISPMILGSRSDTRTLSFVSSTNSETTLLAQSAGSS